MSSKMKIPKYLTANIESRVEVIFQSMEGALTRHQGAKEGWHTSCRHRIWFPVCQQHKEENTVFNGLHF